MKSKRRTTRSRPSRTRSNISAVDETRAAPRVESTGASILSGASSTTVFGGEIINSQRDHNNTTFIIKIGGSESDTSRSTLAISQPSTSGTVKGLPHASTSSSASDLPCSSPSSSSDQEQSSLEEFNTSKDSGLGDSDVSPSFQLPVSPSPTVATPKKLAAAEQRRIRSARFSCPLCPQRFTTQRNLKNHHNSHFGIRVHHCDHCNEDFSTRSSLVRHQKKHR